ncbi:hypothetical protein U8D42_04750 [Mycobacterium europaeum]|uniref:Uncharacterized protein n=1 Tax=Mycobacterium europaeum TaxID=761804 RepID=A0A0U1DDM9_9MYCO|nr:hypothetical protein [Mycobacterium europaeum]MEA1159133.1 hypothetical protein [Mycobacterium europaeum]CQD12442.1 hypothetical protein BN000_02629 [Mycobacterium europaeum]
MNRSDSTKPVRRARRLWHGWQVLRYALTVAATVLGGAAAIPFAPPAAADQDNYVAFLSPSRNISCEINYQRRGIPDETFCFTLAPPASVSMDTAGTLSRCTGESCLANPAEGTPILGYGQTRGAGPFTCRSESGGVTCTVASGRGFTVSSSGIAPVG